MRYFIGYLIKGEAESAHRNLSRDLSSKFGLKDPNSTAPPHLTFKAPFRTDKIEEVEKLISDFVNKIKMSKLKLENFGNFGDQVLFVNVKASNDMKKEVMSFLEELRGIKWMEWKSLENKELNFHATLAKRDIQEKFNSILEYLKEIKFSYDLEFDNIAILKHMNGKWIVYKEYAITS